MEGVVISLEADRQKSICRALTHVLQQTDLRDQVDPKSFYMHLKSNFEVLSRPQGLDLIPLWASLHGRLGEDPRLPGLFLGFAKSGLALGLVSKLPAEVARLDDAAREQALELAFSSGGQEAIIESLHAPDTSLSTDEMPLLTTQDLLPVLDEQRKRAITSLVVQNLRASGVGPRIDGAQLAFRIDEYFEELCDGEVFDLGPVLESLREIEGFTDAEAYVGVIRMQRALQELNIDLIIPELQVDPEHGRQLLDAASLRSTPRARNPADAELAGDEAPARPAPPKTSGAVEGPPPPEKSEGKGTKLERELRRYSLLGISRARWRTVRLSVLSVLLVGGVDSPG